jgi:hypothetical protein
METNIPHTHGPQHNDPGHSISNNVMYNPAEFANASSEMPSECSLKITQPVPWYPTLLIRNNAPVLQVLLILLNLV